MALARCAGWTVLFFWLTYVSSANAANFFVSPTGADSNPGSESSPLRTIQRGATLAQPGDVIHVRPGLYDEQVITVRGGSSESLRIQFLADRGTDPLQKVIVRGFTINHPYISIESFDLTYRIPRPVTTSIMPDAGNLVVNPNGSFCKIQKNTFRDGVVVIANDLVFRSTDGAIYSPSSNFRDSGFAPGMPIYLGSSSKKYYNNHGTAKTVRSVSEDGHTLFIVEGLVAETTNPWFGIVYLGGSNNGFKPLHIQLGSGTDAASNCTVTDNIFRSNFGTNIVAHGNNHLFERNLIEDMRSFDAIRIFGSNNTFRRNIVRNSPNFIYYSSTELGQIPHPEGGNYYDHMIAALYTFGGIEERRNNTFENNYFENCYNQLGMFEESPIASGLTMRNNIFIGIPLQMSVSVKDSLFENNTFYRATYETTLSMAFGPRFSTSPNMTGLSIMKNVFVDGGAKRYNGIENEGSYGVVDPSRTNFQADYNFVAGPESLGFAGKRGFAGREPHGINGGDPVFRDATDPDGQDNTPLTDDDGLRPLPSSPLCGSDASGQPQLGAYSCLTCSDGTPFPYFSLTGATNWFDQRDQTWLILAPEARGRPWRPYTDPETVGYAPVDVSFDAAKSVSCVTDQSTDANGITTYAWEFGDGTPLAQGRQINHRFQQPGDYTVRLTVGNSLGLTRNISRRYKVLSSRPGVVLWAPFNNDLSDQSLRRHDLSWTGTPSFTTSGKWGPAATVQGGSGINIAHSDDLDGREQITFAIWAKKQTAASVGRLLGKQTVFDLTLNPNGELRAYINDENELTAPVTTIAQIPGLAADSGIWHHYAVTYDGQNMRIYFDGQLVPTATKVVTGRLYRARSTAVTAGLGFEGDIDDLRVYETALAADQISQLYSSETGPAIGNDPGPAPPANLRVK